MSGREWRLPIRGGRYRVSVAWGAATLFHATAGIKRMYEMDGTGGLAAVWIGQAALIWDWTTRRRYP